MKNVYAIPLAVGFALQPSDAIAKDKKYAVLLIDADYTLDDAYHPTNNPYGFWNLEEEINNMQKVLKAANAQDIPVFEIIDLIAKTNMCWNNYFWDERHEAYSKLQKEGYCQANPLLRSHWNKNWEHIPKTGVDSFEETTLDDSLKRLDITDIIIMGQNEFDCVYYTSKTARQLGYNVHMSFDVTQSGGVEEDHQCQNEDKRPCNFNQLRRFYARNTHLADSYRDLPNMQGMVQEYTE